MPDLVRCERMEKKYGMWFLWNFFPRSVLSAERPQVCCANRLKRSRARTRDCLLIDFYGEYFADLNNAEGGVRVFHALPQTRSIGVQTDRTNAEGFTFR